MYRAFLSWRYLRARRANWIGIVGICVGVGAMILILSIMAGFLDENRKMVRGSLSDIVIQPALGLARPDGRAVPTEPDATLALVRSDPRVEAACAQLAYYAILSQDGLETKRSERLLTDPQYNDLSGARLFGIDVEDEFATSELRQALTREPLLGGSRVEDPEHPFASPPGYHPEGRPLASIVVGEQIAEAWQLTRGSEVNLATAVRDSKTGEYSSVNRRFVVAGTFRSSDNELDGQRIYLEREELCDWIAPPSRYSQILVKLKDYPRDGAAVRTDLQERLNAAGLIHGPFTFSESREVKTWEEFRKTLLGAIENERVLMAIMLSLVVVVAGFTVFAILSMMITEKRRDIGILSALGATSQGVAVLFLMIAFWDWLLGAGAGALLGTWGALKIDSIERWLSSTFHIQIFNRKVYLFDHIPAVVDPVAVAAIVLGALFCVLLFAAIPAFKAGRLHPLDALRYE
ncbi:MAG TPA: FtsX-like permease family protein [Planctomycetota bacterium]|jgi:lipoprotein-releasing system permease protein|nr:FtsX-like permease family protein [Planctomycetota bacterium]